MERGGPGGAGGAGAADAELGRLDYALRFLAWSAGAGLLDQGAHTRLRRPLEQRWIELTAPLQPARDRDRSPGGTPRGPTGPDGTPPRAPPPPPSAGRRARAARASPVRRSPTPRRPPRRPAPRRPCRHPAGRAGPSAPARRSPARSPCTGSPTSGSCWSSPAPSGWCCSPSAASTGTCGRWPRPPSRWCCSAPPGSSAAGDRGSPPRASRSSAARSPLSPRSPRSPTASRSRPTCRPGRPCWPPGARSRWPSRPATPWPEGARAARAACARSATWSGRCCGRRPGSPGSPSAGRPAGRWRWSPPPWRPAPHGPHPGPARSPGASWSPRCPAACARSGWRSRSAPARAGRPRRSPWPPPPRCSPWRWTWIDLAGGTLAAMAALAVWRRGGTAAWLPALIVLAPLLSAVGLLVAIASGRPPLLVAALLVAGLQAAVAGLVTGNPWLQGAAPVLVCAAWLEFAREALAGDPQWFTVPIGLALLWVVEVARAYRRRAALAVAPGWLVALELAGMLLVVGAALVQTVTASLFNGLLAVLLAAGLLGWGVLTRVRRRAVAGVAGTALAAFLLVAVPVARLLPTAGRPGLWLALAAAGLLLLLVASFIERGRVRARAAARRVDRLLVGWE